MNIFLELPEILEQQLREEAARSGKSLGSHIVQRLATAGSLPADRPPSEQDLLKMIKLDLGIAPSVWKRYYHLADQLSSSQMTETDHKEFQELLELIESANLERLKYLIQLSDLRGHTLERTMTDLGIRPYTKDNL